MPLNIPTIAFILGVTHLLQIVVFSHQYRVNKAYKGIGWWLAWSTLECIGFFAILVREIPEWNQVAIIVQNTTIAAGTLCIYAGVRRFYELDARIKWLAFIFSCYVIFLHVFVFIRDDIWIRSIVTNLFYAGIAFVTAYSLLKHRKVGVRATAVFNAVVFIIHGALFLFRSVIILSGMPVGGTFSPTVFNFLPYFDALIVSLAWSFGFIIMINQRLYAEMMASKDHFQKIFDTSPDAAFITRMEDGLIVNVNHAFINQTGYTFNEAAGRSTITLELWKNPRDRNIFVTMLSEMGSCENYEAVFVRKDGTEIYGLVSARIIELNGVRHILNVTKDITDRKLAELEVQKLNSEMEERVLARTAELVEANRELENFTYTVSHDLRSPLRAMNGFARILFEEYFNVLDDEAKRLIGIIDDNARKMGKLIDGLLAYSKLGRTDMTISLINMHDLAEKAFREVSSDEDKNDVEFRLNDIPNIHGDTYLVFRVWVHLIANAIKFTSKKPQRVIEIGFIPGVKNKTYYVKDNGVGFDMAYGHKLFGVFQRLHTQDEYEGTGIGLAMVQRIIHRMHGTVRAEGIVDEGATFYFSLPDLPEKNVTGTYL